MRGALRHPSGTGTASPENADDRFCDHRIPLGAVRNRLTPESLARRLCESPNLARLVRNSISQIDGPVCLSRARGRSFLRCVNLFLWWLHNPSPPSQTARTRSNSKQPTKSHVDPTQIDIQPVYPPR